MIRDEIKYVLSLKEFPLKKKGNKGKLVRLIQEWLCLNNLNVVIDGDYGPATEEAIKKFQSLNLPFYNLYNLCNQVYPTGETDNHTFDLLSTPMRIILSKTFADVSLSKTVVTYARLHLKKNPREVGGQNKGPWVRLYMSGLDGRQYPWCCGFVSYIVEQASKAKGIDMPFSYSWSVPKLAREAKSNGIFLSGKTGNPLPGYIFLQRSKRGYSHCGLVISINLSSFKTIEGNTNDEGSAEGYEVCTRIRSYKNKDFVIIK